jgi:hypothetical protein
MITKNVTESIAMYVIMISVMAAIKYLTIGSLNIKKKTRAIKP